MINSFFPLLHNFVAYTIKHFLYFSLIHSLSPVIQHIPILLLWSLSLLSNNSARFAVLTTILSAVATPNEQTSLFYSPGSSSRCLQSLSNRLIHTLCKNIAVLVPAILHPILYCRVALCIHFYLLFNFVLFWGFFITWSIAAYPAVKKKKCEVL